MGKNTSITMAQLSKLAEKSGVSIATMREIAIAQNYSIVEDTPAINIAELLATVEEKTPAAIVVSGSMDSYLDTSMTDQAIFDLLMVQSFAVLEASAKVTKRQDSTGNSIHFATDSFRQTDQFSRQADNKASRWFNVIAAAQKIAKSLDADMDNAKVRLVCGMIAWFRNLATVQEKDIPAAIANKPAKPAKTPKVADGVSKKTAGGKAYVEAPSQAEKHEKANKAKNDDHAMAINRHAEVEAFMAKTDFSGFPYVESYLRGALSYNAQKAGIVANPDKVAWEAAIAAADYRKKARKFAKKGNVAAMAMLIIDNMQTYKGLAFVHKGLQISDKSKYSAFGSVNPLYVGLEDYVPFLQEASKLANAMQREATAA